MTLLLKGVGLTKRFGGLTALEGVDIGLHSGEVLALIGENGAGKSTLIHLLTGSYACDAGHIENFANFSSAEVAVVHQDPQLITSLSGLDNLFIGRAFPSFALGTLISRSHMRLQALAACEGLGLSLPLDDLVLDYTPTQRFQLALLRCWMQKPAVLILDEPTAALTSHDAEMLMQLLRRWTGEGIAVLYVSHRLEEVLQISQRILVLRNGKQMATLATAQQSHADLVSAMSGQTHSAVAQLSVSSSKNAVVLQMQNVQTSDATLQGVDMVVHQGELVGLYGLAGAGRSEILETLMGLRTVQSGRMLWRTQSYEPSGPGFAARTGLALVPEDRRQNALVLGMRLRENLSLSFLHRLSRFGCLLRRREKNFAKHWMQALAIKARDSEQPVSELSGGNQQKVVIGKWLATRPKVLLLDEPTRGVDIGAIEQIHARILAERERGAAVLLISSDLSEILALSDRILVMHGGRIVGELTPEEATEERLGLLMAGVTA
mgnify:CR=1 FL=1